jgi:hypothetical protein
MAAHRDGFELERVAVDSLEGPGDRPFTFLRYSPSQWTSLRTTDAIERPHEAFKRRIKRLTLTQPLCVPRSGVIAPEGWVRPEGAERPQGGPTHKMLGGHRQSPLGLGFLKLIPTGDDGDDRE